MAATTFFFFINIYIAVYFLLWKITAGKYHCSDSLTKINEQNEKNSIEKYQAISKYILYNKKIIKGFTN